MVDPARTSLLALQGPKAAGVLESLDSVSTSSLSCRAGLAGLRIPVISRSGYTGEDGFEIALPPSLPRRSPNWLAGTSASIRSALALAIGCGSRPGFRLYGHDLDRHRRRRLMAGLRLRPSSKRRRAERDFSGAERIFQGDRGWPGPEARRSSTWTVASPVREGALSPGWRRQRSWPDHQRRLLAHPAAADRHGLCRQPPRRARNGAEASSSAVKLLDAEVTTMPFVPHRYHRKGASA